VEITKGDTGDRPAPPIDFMFYIHQDLCFFLVE